MSKVICNTLSLGTKNAMKKMSATLHCTPKTCVWTVAEPWNDIVDQLRDIIRRVGNPDLARVIPAFIKYWRGKLPTNFVAGDNGLEKSAKHPKTYFPECVQFANACNSMADMLDEILVSVDC